MEKIPAETKAMIGKKRINIYDVTKKDIRRFAQAIGDPNPLYYDEEYARETRYGKIIAPPLFCHSFAFEDVPAEKLREDGLPAAGRSLPLKTNRIMAGGKEVEFFKPMRPGDTITQVGKIIDIYEKEGRSGPLVFTVYENRYTNQDGELVAVEKLTSIHR